MSKTEQVTAKLLTDVEEAARRLRQGELVAFATETVYGLGANALDPRAVARIFEAKQRPLFDPLIVHLADAADVVTLARDIPPAARLLMDRFWPGPLTLVLPKQPVVPDLVTSGLETVAVRIPDHPQARELIRRAGIPVAAPSANLFGRISPTTAEHVLDQLGDRIDAVLDGGPCRVGVESSVVTFPPGEAPRLLRPGGISVEELESVLGTIDVPEHRSDAGGPGEPADQPLASPGMLPKHYAPTKPITLTHDWNRVPCGPEVGALAFQSVPDPDRFGQVEVLSPSGSLTEAAAGFFAALRRLDAAPTIRQIVAQRFPDEGLGRALNDRLSRAAAQNESAPSCP
jgi:L-threonylcarbamoyladenylate synthase